MIPGYCIHLGQPILIMYLEVTSIQSCEVGSLSSQRRSAPIHAFISNVKVHSGIAIRRGHVPSCSLMPELPLITVRQAHPLLLLSSHLHTHKYSRLKGATNDGPFFLWHRRLHYFYSWGSLKFQMFLMGQESSIIRVSSNYLSFSHWFNMWFLAMNFKINLCRKSYVPLILT